MKTNSATLSARCIMTGGLRHQDSISLKPLTFTTRVTGFSKHSGSKLIFPCEPDGGPPYSHIQSGAVQAKSWQNISLVLLDVDDPPLRAAWVVGPTSQTLSTARALQVTLNKVTWHVHGRGVCLRQTVLNSKLN